MTVYFNGNYIEQAEVSVSLSDRGFLLGDGVYEVMRTYNGKLFRLEDHLKRLKKSLVEIKINITNQINYESIIKKLIRLNNAGKSEISAYIQITRGAASSRTHRFPQPAVNPTTFISITKLNDTDGRNVTGVKVITTEDIRWSRCDIKSISLLANVLANQKAYEAGAYDALWVRNGQILEGSHTSFFGVKNGTIFTAPLSNFILDSVTRKVVLELCKNTDIPVMNETIYAESIEQYDEFFVAGTTTEIKPVIMIDNKKIGKGAVGSVTAKLLDAYSKFTSKK